MKKSTLLLMPAPEWATHLAQDSDGTWHYFSGPPLKGEESWFAGWDKKEIAGKTPPVGDWASTSTSLPERPPSLEIVLPELFSAGILKCGFSLADFLSSSPNNSSVKQRNNLPEAGDKVLGVIRCHQTKREEKKKVEILKVVDRDYAVFCPEWGTLHWCDSIESIPTEEEVNVKAMLGLLPERNTADSEEDARRICTLLYKAGLRFTDTATLS